MTEKQNPPDKKKTDGDTAPEEWRPEEIDKMAKMDRDPVDEALEEERPPEPKGPSISDAHRSGS